MKGILIERVEFWYGARHGNPHSTLVEGNHVLNTQQRKVFYCLTLLIEFPHGFVLVLLGRSFQTERLERMSEHHGALS